MLEMISIIVTVYDREYLDKCVEECIESIKNQTYQNWEMIIVDDGSGKCVAEWLDRHAEGRIRVVHQENAGVSAARNRGIQEAKGEWIYFCDQDDIMKKDELEKLYSAAENDKSDIVVCGYEEIDAGGCVIGKKGNVKRETICISDTENLLFELVGPGIMEHYYNVEFQKYSLRFPWAHLYRKECIKNVKFPIGLHPGEDKIFNILAYKNARKITLLNEKLHQYRIGYGVTGRYEKTALDNARRVRSLCKEIMSYAESTKLYKGAFAKMEADEIAYLMKRYFFHKDNPLCKNERAEKFSIYLKQDLKYYPKYVFWNTLTKNQVILLFVYRLKLISFMGYFLNCSVDS